MVIYYYIYLMKFTLPIDSTREQKVYLTYYDYLNGKKVRSSYIWIALGIVYILVGWFLHDILYSLFDIQRELWLVKTTLIIVGIMQAFIYGYYILYYSRHKKKYLDELERQYRLMDENNVTEYTLALSDHHLTIENELYSTKIAWSLIHSYQLLNDTLIIHINKGVGLFHLFSKEEFEEEDYNNIVNYVQSRVNERTQK